MPILVNWNIARHVKASKQARSIVSEITPLDPDLVCFTEAHADSFLDMEGHVISAAGKMWSSGNLDERKVALFSKQPWIQVQAHEDLNAVGGCISGVTEFGGAPVRIIGVCIPYHMAGRTLDGVTLWLQHMRFVDGLRDLLERSQGALPIIIVGDFNRKIPRQWGSELSYDKLLDCLSDYKIHTEGALGSEGLYTVDHVATSPDLVGSGLLVLPATDPRGVVRSDHFGIKLDLERVGP